MHSGPHSREISGREHGVNTIEMDHRHNQYPETETDSEFDGEDSAATSTSQISQRKATKEKKDAKTKGKRKAKRRERGFKDGPSKLTPGIDNFVALMTTYGCEKQRNESNAPKPNANQPQEPGLVFI